MIEYDYNLDRVNFEIFPEEIWENVNVVFHGTSQYHANSIETNGFVTCTPPFNLEDGEELIRLLQRPEVSGFDQPKGFFGMTTSRSLASYIWGIKNCDFRLSFAYLSYLCVTFSAGNLKGGQTLGTIREAKQIIEQAIQVNPAISTLISEPIQRLFDLEQTIAEAQGVVYAIKLQPPYNGITEEYGTIHSNISIGPEMIIGKVRLPIDMNTAEFTIEFLKEKNREKLIKPGNLGVLLYRQTHGY